MPAQTLATPYLLAGKSTNLSLNTSTLMAFKVLT